jgi:UDP-glucose 4-epimerase
LWSDVVRASRVLVSGGAGFIGSHVVDRLLGDGYDVTVLDDLSSGSLDNVARHEGKKGFHFVKGDIRERAR